MQRRSFLIYSVAGIGAIAATLGIGWWRVDGPGADAPVGKRPLPLTEMSFRLTDHEGKSVGPQSLLGRASLVFFGFTYCPEVCPTTLSDISTWLDGLGEDAADLNVVLITVDPERDTVEALAEYVGYFHPAIRGWTGTTSQVDQATSDFRVRYEKRPMEGGGYTMNHTSGVFLFGADGRHVTIIDYHEPREFALPKIRRAMNA